MKMQLWKIRRERLRRDHGCSILTRKEAVIVSRKQMKDHQIHREGEGRRGRDRRKNKWEKIRLQRRRNNQYGRQVVNSNRQPSHLRIALSTGRDFHSPLSPDCLKGILFFYIFYRRAKLQLFSIL